MQATTPKCSRIDRNTSLRLLGLVVFLLALPLLPACQEAVTPLVEPEVDLGANAKLLDFQDPCDCDPFNPLEALLIFESCGDATPTGAVCYEVNTSPYGLNPTDPSEIYCTYTLQKKEEYVQICSIKFSCYPSRIPCELSNYEKHIWKTVSVTESGPVICGRNPFASYGSLPCPH